METKPIANERYLTVRQVADFLNICRQSVYRMAATGAIPPGVRFGRLRRWPESELIASLRPVNTPKADEKKEVA